jgi:hypothetical protein
VLRSTHWSYVPRAVIDDAGRARVLIVFGGGAAREVWNGFAATPVAESAIGIVITVERDGALGAVRELPRGLLRPQSVTDIEGLRWLRGGLVLVGRNAPAPLPEDGLAWDGFIVHLVDGETAPRLGALVDLDGAAALSDVAAAGVSAWLVAGRSGYWQNPHGASISEEAASELAVLDAAGAVVRRLELPQGRRHNGALSIAASGAARGAAAGAYFVGGLTNGPG